MGLNNELCGYSHPNYTVTREHRTGRIQGPLSTIDFAHFRSRNTTIVRSMTLRMISAASASLSVGSVCVTRRFGNSTLSSHTVSNGTAWAASAAMTGTTVTVTLSSSNTLTSISDYMAIRLIGLDVGEYDVLWEYDVVYPGTKIGA
jgi:hypothetical protein